MNRWLLSLIMVAALAGCGPQSSSPSSNASNAGKTEEDAAKASRKTASDRLIPEDLLAGLDELSEVKKELAEFEKEWREKPEGAEKRIIQLSVHNNLGKYFLSEYKPKQAYACWLAAGKLADDVAAKKEELKVEQYGLLGSAYYNAACALSQAGKQDAALASLNKAIEWEYSDLEKLAKDEDLAPLRKEHDFDKLMPQWEETAIAVGKAHAQHMLKEAAGFEYDFEVKDLDGQTRKLADYEGSVLIVDIWGTWCPPCRKEIPHFVKLVKQHGPEGFKMLGLNYREDSEEDVKEFIKKFEINYPCSVQEGEPGDIPNFEGFPTTLFFDRTGKVRLKVVGYHSYYLLNGVVTTLLAEK